MINLFLVSVLGVEAQLRVHPPEDVALLSETEMLPSLPEIKLPHTEKSLVLAEVRRFLTPANEVAKS